MVFWEQAVMKRLQFHYLPPTLFPAFCIFKFKVNSTREDFAIMKL